MTLKTVLKNFLNYADTLEAQKKLGNDIYEQDFQKLKGLTEELKRDKDYATSEGLKEVNRRKNRYKDILPYDYTRVILSEYPGVPGSDFINANYIKGASGSLAYIASQGPLPNTVVDFWRMIWECEVQVIVMACNEQESGKYKCECYWPTDEEKKQYGNINVEFVKWRQVCPDFLVRTLKACWESEERVICQFHYTTWPDHGVPTSVQPILELVRLIRDCQASEAVPVLVHCSAGCGRTGTICAIDFVWGLMRMGKLTKNFNLFNVIADMRRQRIAMVQTKEQYVLVHKAVSSLFEQQLRVIDSHTYENLDEDGEPLILKEMLQEEDIYEDILDPPSEENYAFEKTEKSMQLVKAFPELMYSAKESTVSGMKKETYLDYLCHLKKISQNEIGNNVSLAEVKNNSEQSNRILQEDEKTENNSKEIDFDADLHYSKNSRTLQKLRREESVKRLISGWNKAVDHPDESAPVGKESQFENQNPDTYVAKNSNLYEPKTSLDQLHNQHSFVIVDKTMNNNKTSMVSTEDSPKTSSPEDTHSGKLVGKATVIRRPSIAKLKALFEKSAQASVESSDSNRQRRTLFRSHSHYVSNSSRSFTLSDSSDQNQHSNLSSDQPHILNRDDYSQRENNNQRLPSEHHKFSNDTSSRSTENARSVINSDSIRQLPNETFFDAKKNVFFNTNAQRDMFPSVSDSHSHFDAESEEQKILMRKQGKEKPPLLPVKKKLPAPPLPTEAGDKSLTENTVPRFQVNLDKNQGQSEYSHIGDIQTQKEIEMGRVKYVNADESVREYRRHSHEAERKILHKNQSFSDPEQGTGRTLEMNKQAVKPKSSLTDQTYPKLSYSCGKTTSDDKLLLGNETTYMNVNSLAQKNIRQIEDKLKNHPRGAIIDLTSRKSYIDEMATSAEKNYVFRNTSQPVKFLQPQESRDLTPLEKYNANKVANTASKLKTNDAKESSNKNDSDPNSKNLLLHSPPPKSKRGHLSKNVKSPVSPPSTTAIAAVTSNTVTPSQQAKNKQAATKVLQPANFTLVNSPPNLNIAISNNTNVASNNTNNMTTTSNVVGTTNSSTVSSNSSTPTSNTTFTINSSSTAPDRSDPRYFPVNRQTASDAKYESERHKALSRERSQNIYETLYSVKSSVPIYQKLPYDKARIENPETINSKTHPKDFKYSHESSKISVDKEPLYGLQRSKSGPQVLPPVPGPTHKATQSCDLTKSMHKELGQPPHFDPKESFHHSNNQLTSYMPGPPKPPRTFHYDQKGNHENIPVSEYHKSDNINRDGGRYIVTVASPKHSNQYPTMIPPRNGPNLEYRYSDANHHNNPQNIQYQYVPQPSKDVHMSRSYPFTNYDNLYSHPRPYSKQFQPESMVYRNVQPVSHVTNSLYSTVKEKPSHVKQDMYGTVKHRNTYADYENVYDAQSDYRHAMSAPHLKNEHKNFCQPSQSQYGQADTNIYGVIQPPMPHSHISKSSHLPDQREYQNFDPSAKRVYFDTLQRKQKQHVSWEQRRSHDDMDIRPAPSARLREQIHARRSMVELDNLEISVVSDEGYPSKNIPEGTMSSPETHTKMESNKSEHFNDSTQGKPPASEHPKEANHKRSSSHGKENTSFGETLSKAFGRLTSLTKFSSKDSPSSSANANDSSNNGTKAAKPKDPEKQTSFTVQSPENMKESPSEQWTQV